jgi:hypothetical protein
VARAQDGAVEVAMQDGARAVGDRTATMTAWLCRNDGDFEVYKISGRGNEGKATTLLRAISVDAFRKEFGEPDWIVSNARGFVPAKALEGEAWCYGRIILFVMHGSVLQFAEFRSAPSAPPQQVLPPVQETPSAPPAAQPEAPAAAQPAAPAVAQPERPVQEPVVADAPKTVTAPQPSPAAILPGYTEALDGRNELRAYNPYDCRVYAVVRHDHEGKNFEVPPHAVASINVPDNTYEVYLVYGDEPDVLYRGDKVRLHGRAVTLNLDRAPRGDYGIVRLGRGVVVEE